MFIWYFESVALFYVTVKSSLPPPPYKKKLAANSKITCRLHTGHEPDQTKIIKAILRQRDRKENHTWLWNQGSPVVSLRGSFSKLQRVQEC